MIRKISIILLWIVSLMTLSLWWLYHEAQAAAPRFEADFADHLTQRRGANSYGNESFWDLWVLGFRSELSLQDNIKNMFYPDLNGEWWRVRDLIKGMGLIVFIVMIIRQGLQYVLKADTGEDMKTIHTNFAYIFLWWLIFFWATWILWVGLGLSGTTSWSEQIVRNLDNNIVFQIFSGIRAAMFFMAIVILWYTGWRVIAGTDDGEKMKTAKNGLLNVIIPLIVVKVIDYIYYIAQTPDFKNQATTLIVEISKVLWYILWWFFTIILIYYGFRLMFSGGNDEHLKKVKSVIVGVFLWSLVIFIFFLIIYQITQEFS